MVRTEHLRMYSGVTNTCIQRRTYKKVVYPPTDIPCSSIGKVAPPCVVSGTFSEHPERVDKVRINGLIYALSFLLGKSVLALVIFWVREVVRSVSHIQIAAKYNGLFVLESP